ncbi:MAG: fibronectin type III-like domain-contianing protein, partial [Anaerolineae bacterium]|nr:fibronectin type III-like domain-contianing protein [Anaerolineae bacterium]
YHGYTLLDKCDAQPAFPFGFGLGYTTFAYSDLRVVLEGDALRVRVKVTNTGARAGEEVAQVYIGMDHSRVDRPKKLLKGFEKVAIPFGESVDVAISIPLDDLRYYDAQGGGWRLEAGAYRIMAGSCSDDAALLSALVQLDAPFANVA